VKEMQNMELIMLYNVIIINELQDRIPIR
jgi:hypothetical protein